MKKVILSDGGSILIERDRPGFARVSFLDTAGTVLFSSFASYASLNAYPCQASTFQDHSEAA